ncbi:MAG: hypothetical protein M0002_21255 [Rhodospirillales bacterium]|nr:hypothetical protein [Rhodospirillales bacterium]
MTCTRRGIGSFGMALGGLSLLPVAAFAAGGVSKSPPGPPYKAASKLFALPNFLPGLGTLYVDPKTLPYGPWLGYDHSGRLVNTLYMVPLKNLDAHKNIAGLAAPGGKVVRVDMYFNPGHPGLLEPHYHIILWHEENGPESVAK